MDDRMMPETVFEFRRRMVDDFREWKDIPVHYEKAFFAFEPDRRYELAGRVAMGFLEENVSEVRYNAKGSYQGYYVNHASDWGEMK